jgi:hypothetical protein
MIGLSRTRGFSVGNRQILPTSNLKCGPLMTCTLGFAVNGRNRAIEIKASTI